MTHYLSTDLDDFKDALTDIFDEYGQQPTADLLEHLRQYAVQLGINPDAPLSKNGFQTPYDNTIPLQKQPFYHGNAVLEEKIENIIRWNAAAMVLQQSDKKSEVGGHIASYMAASTMMEVGFNHFFRKGDLVLIQGHIAPGIYARAALEGRLSEAQLKKFRRELAPEGGLCSYPHPRRMANFWEVPSVSMGLGPLTAIAVARFWTYLEKRQLKSSDNQRIWCYIGDGEMDEPEILGSAGLAAREGLNRLTFVVNCNLQRLDGPVRGNGKVMQEFENAFAGLGWNVVKVVWSGDWDALFEADTEGVLRRRLEAMTDGDFQYIAALPPENISEIRSILRGSNVEESLKIDTLLKDISDENLQKLRRGGHDRSKIFAAYTEAEATTDKPTVILIKTLKGNGLGQSAEAKNTAHQTKNLSGENRIAFAKHLNIPISDAEAAQATFYFPEKNSPEIQYLMERRNALGGFLPQRTEQYTPLSMPGNSVFGVQKSQ